MKNQIMEALLGLYYNSKTFKGDNIKNQSFSIAPTKICKGYGDNFKRKETEAFDTACSELEFAGFIMLDKKPQGAIISIKLNKDRIMDAEFFLENSIGFKAKTKIVAELQTFINNVEISNIYVEAYINELCEKIEKNSKSLPDIEEASDIAKILSSLTLVKSETYIREYSQLLLGNTKTFEEKYLLKTCSLLLNNFDFIIDDENKKEKVLEEFNILSNPGYVYLKGKIEITINGFSLDLAPLQGFALCEKDFINISNIIVNEENLITIENITSFNRFSETEFACVFLGGYHNECRRNLLKLIYQNNPKLNYYHCGDIDSGGLYIFEHLKEKTGIPFNMYLMNIKTLSDIRYKDARIKLTMSDIKRLKDIRNKGLHIELIDFMLSCNYKLEQEMITMINHLQH
jgi:hypothetical protein